MATHPGFLPRKSQGQRSLAVCSWWGSHESDKDLKATEHIHTFIYLALSSLICGTQELSLCHEVSFIVVCRFQSVGFSSCVYMGFVVPHSMWDFRHPTRDHKLNLLHCKADF